MILCIDVVWLLGHIMLCILIIFLAMPELQCVNYKSLMSWRLLFLYHILAFSVYVSIVNVNIHANKYYIGLFMFLFGNKYQKFHPSLKQSTWIVCGKWSSTIVIQSWFWFHFTCLFIVLKHISMSCTNSNLIFLVDKIRFIILACILSVKCYIP